MNFDTSSVVEREVQESTYIKPGINEPVSMESFVANTENVPYMQVEFSCNGKTASGRFYLPEGADEESVKNRNSNLARIKHMATKVVTAEEFDAAGKSSSNLTQYCENLTTLLKGKTFRMKFSGKQMPGKDGKKEWDLATIPNQRFAESLEIPREKTKLVYDPKNQYDYKALPVADTKDASGLPF